MLVKEVVTSSRFAGGAVAQRLGARRDTDSDGYDDRREPETDRAPRAPRAPFPDPATERTRRVYDGYAVLPIVAPTTAMTAPPSVTYPSDLTKLVSKKRQRIAARPMSSKATITPAVTTAVW